MIFLYMRYDTSTFEMMMRMMILLHLVQLLSLLVNLLSMGCLVFHVAYPIP